MPGRLFYIMGASGVGKDTLLRNVRAQLDLNDRILIAHRYITRPPTSDENHIALTAQEFNLREEGHLFAFGWSSHGYQYAVGCEIDAWMQAGFDVVVNGSRAALEPIRAKDRILHAVLITASVATLRTRLVQRGRDTAGQIEERLRRHEGLEIPRDAQVIRNDGALEKAASELLDILRASPGG